MCKAEKYRLLSSTSIASAVVPGLVRSKPAAVIPTAIGRSVVRVDVAEAGVAAIVQVATATHRTNHGSIHEVRADNKTAKTAHRNPNLLLMLLRYCYSGVASLDYNEFRYSHFLNLARALTRLWN